MKRFALLLAWMVLSAASPAWAQSGEAYDAISQANKLARAGAITRSIPFYEKGLKLDPTGYTLAYFNLAEVWRSKGRTSKAAFFYTLYLRHGDDETTSKQALQALAELKTDSWGKLSVTGTPIEDARITIDGFLLASGEEVTDLELPAGDYEIEVTAVDHIARKKTVEVPSGSRGIMTYGLEKMTFFGTILVNVNVEGANVKIHAGPSDETRVVHEGTAPMKEPVKIEEGRHFVEIKAKDHRRWIRNVSVGRDSEVVVEASLTRALPPEIRRKTE